MKRTKFTANVVLILLLLTTVAAISQVYGTECASTTHYQVCVSDLLGPTATSTPSVVPSPTPTALPTPACVSITSPANGAIVSGVSVPIITRDVCPRVWFEKLYVDGVFVGAFATGAAVLNSTINGLHTITITSQSANPGSVVLGSASGIVNVQAAAPTPTPVPGGLSISVSGNKLVSADGAPVFLHGVNRSGAEYACISNSGVFSGPTDQASVDAMKAWNINSVRIPLNEDCLLGINGTPPAYSGANYTNDLVNYVNLLESSGLYVILDLHWNAPAGYLANSQEPMADADHAPAFWGALVRTFATNRGVMFDLYNEPYPNGNPVPAWNWRCWANGGCSVPCSYGACKGASYTVAGMGQLLGAVRNAEGTGWHHPVLIGGLGSASDLTGWLANHPVDPAGQLVANAHAYNDGQSCQNPSIGGCLDTTWKMILASGYPLTLDEFGQSGCVWNSWLDAMMAWMETRGTSGYTPWGWDAGASCSDPGMITDWSGTAYAYGASYRAHISALSAGRRRLQTRRGAFDGQRRQGHLR